MQVKKFSSHKHFSHCWVYETVVCVFDIPYIVTLDAQDKPYFVMANLVVIKGDEHESWQVKRHSQPPAQGNPNRKYIWDMRTANYKCIINIWNNWSRVGWRVVKICLVRQWVHEERKCTAWMKYLLGELWCKERVQTSYQCMNQLGIHSSSHHRWMDIFGNPLWWRWKDSTQQGMDQLDLWKSIS